MHCAPAVGQMRSRGCKQRDEGGVTIKGQIMGNREIRTSWLSLVVHRDRRAFAEQVSGDQEPYRREVGVVFLMQYLERSRGIVMVYSPAPGWLQTGSCLT